MPTQPPCLTSSHCLCTQSTSHKISGSVMECGPRPPHTKMLPNSLSLYLRKATEKFIRFHIRNFTKLPELGIPRAYSIMALLKHISRVISLCVIWSCPTSVEEGKGKWRVRKKSQNLREGTREGKRRDRREEMNGRGRWFQSMERGRKNSPLRPAKHS